VVPESVMPQYGFLAETNLEVADRQTSWRCRASASHTADDIANAAHDLKAQADPLADAGTFASRYPKVQSAISTVLQRLTEMDALVAYLQMLGTLVDVNGAAAQEELAQETGR
jgi:cytochrome c oxidase cbb3-type subunit 2